MVQYLIQSKGFGQSEAPALFKGSSDHGCAGGGRCRSQAKWVGKPDTTNLNTDVHLIYGTIEQRQLWDLLHCLPMQRLEK